jgi:hypothetical protein
MDLDLADATPEAYRARVIALFNEQRAEDAEALLREALRRHPANGDLRSRLPYALLMQGRYRDGFRELEHRDARLGTLAKNFPIPEWDGPIAGRSILLLGEGGLGDEIQLARYLARLRDLGARRIYVACLRENIRIFRQLGADEAVDRNVACLDIRDSDCWLRMLSLPYRLGLDLKDISGAPYLSAKPLPQGGIGLVEQGNPKNPRDQVRSLPAGLLQSSVPDGRLLEPAGDVYDSLCRIAGLELLITVDTSWAHMAGALGAPCWVLLPFSELDWRWLRGRSDSPWYDSLRLFRQPAPGDWASVIAQVRAALQER